MNPNIFASSIYTISNSTLYIKNLVDVDHEIVGICDINTLAGVYAFAKAAKKKNKKTAIGAHIVTKKNIILSVHAINDNGWSRLCEIVSYHNLNEDLDFNLFKSNDIFVTIDAKNELLAAHLNGQKNEISKIIENTPKHRLAVSISRPEGGDEGYDIAERLTAKQIPMIAAPKAVYEKGKKNIYEIISEDEIEKIPTTEMLTEDDIRDLYEDLPGAVENLKTFQEIVCEFTFKTHKPSLPHYIDSFDEKGDLKEFARKGLQEYLSKNPHLDRKTYEDRLEYEAEMITKLGFSGYFLIVADYINYCNIKGIPVGPGRGSGAGSLVAMSLKITTIDPIKYGLFFERFINPDRVSPPDFDIDFCQLRREEVISYIYEKYGADYTCQIGTMMAMQPAAAWRAAARSRNITMGVQNQIAKKIPKQIEGEKLNDAGLQKAMEDPALRKMLAGNPEAKEAMDIAVNLQSMYSSRSRHAAGIIIADHKISSQTPLYTMEKNDTGIPISEFDMKGVEDQGLIKFDFLGLKTLTIIDRACKLIEKDRGIKISPWDLPEEDERVMAMITAGRTANVFQLESDGMTKAAREIKVDRFSDIIALVALYRPGPMDQIPVYAKRKRDPKLVTYAHPALKESLEETYGIPVYQEQIMGIGRTIAGYTLGQSDVLRRAMGKKIAEEMAALKEGFVNGCINNEAISPRVTKSQAEDLFALIEKFASYGFNKAHAAAYARICFVTAYLKCYYYHHFTAAALTQNGYDNEQERIKLTISEMEDLPTPINYLPADVNFSEKEFTVEAELGFDSDDRNFDIRFGFISLKKFKKKAIELITEDREKNGKYATFSEFLNRLAQGISQSDLVVLIHSGALDSLYPEIDQYTVRKALLDIVDLTPKSKHKRIDYYESMTEDRIKFVEPKLSEKANFVTLQSEIYGFNIKNHPVDPYRTLIKNYRMTSLEIAKKVNSELLVKTIAHLAYVEDTGYENKGYLTDKNQLGKAVRMNVVFDKNIMPPNRYEDGNKDGVFLFEIDKKGIVKSWSTVEKITEFIKTKEITEEDEKALQKIEEDKEKEKERLHQVIQEFDEENIPF